MQVTGQLGKPFTSYALSETAFSCLPIRYLRSWAYLTQLHGRCGMKLPLPTTIQLYSKKTTQSISWHLILLCLSLSKLQELVMDREAWHAAIHAVAKKIGHEWATELNWTESSYEPGKRLAGRAWNLAVVLLYGSKEITYLLQDSGSLFEKDILTKVFGISSNP